MPEFCPTRPRFDPQLLQADLSRLASGTWTPHFNAGFFEGDWSEIVLHGSSFDRGLYARSADSFGATEAPEFCRISTDPGIPPSVLAVGDELQGHLVNYTQLPDWGWTTLPRLFGLNPTSHDLDEMRAVSANDAKRSGVPFGPDTEKKHATVSEEVRALSEERLCSLYRKLEDVRDADKGGNP